MYANIHCSGIERRVNGDKGNIHLLESGGILSCCPSFHPIHKRPPSIKLINEVTSRLDRDWTILSRLKHVSDRSATFSIA